MTEIQVRLEIDRVRNLAETFGWKLVNDKREDTKVILTLEKEINIIEVEVDKGAS